MTIFDFSFAWAVVVDQWILLFLAGKSSYFIALSVVKKLILASLLLVLFGLKTVKICYFWCFFGRFDLITAQ